MSQTNREKKYIDILVDRIQQLREIIIDDMYGCGKSCHCRKIELCDQCDAPRLMMGCDDCSIKFNGCEKPFSEVPCEHCNGFPFPEEPRTTTAFEHIHGVYH